MYIFFFLEYIMYLILYINQWQKFFFFYTDIDINDLLQFFIRSWEKVLIVIWRVFCSREVCFYTVGKICLGKLLNTYSLHQCIIFI